MLAENEWKDHDLRLGKERAIKPAKLNMVGFECDSNSAVNNKRKIQGENCLPTAKERRAARLMRFCHTRSLTVLSCPFGRT